MEHLVHWFATRSKRNARRCNKEQIIRRPDRVGMAVTCLDYVAIYTEEATCINIDEVMRIRSVQATIIREEISGTNFQNCHIFTWLLAIIKGLELLTKFFPAAGPPNPQPIPSLVIASEHDESPYFRKVPLHTPFTK
ncbi:hypothetical protein J6590_057706 [Homalodisca vitripennis]|nr:hypothetical protein J6590_057706 [Homalodisca vitripennis]